MGYPAECQPIADAITSMQAQIQSWQVQAQSSSDPMKSALEALIASLNALVALKQLELSNCVEINDESAVNPCQVFLDQIAELTKQINKIYADNYASAAASVKLSNIHDKNLIKLANEIAGQRSERQAKPLVLQINSLKEQYNQCLIAHEQ